MTMQLTRTPDIFVSIVNDHQQFTLVADAGFEVVELWMGLKSATTLKGIGNAQVIRDRGEYRICEALAQLNGLLPRSAQAKLEEALKARMALVGAV